MVQIVMNVLGQSPNRGRISNYSPEYRNYTEGCSFITLFLMISVNVQLFKTWMAIQKLENLKAVGTCFYV